MPEQILVITREDECTSRYVLSLESMPFTIASSPRLTFEGRRKLPSNAEQVAQGGWDASSGSKVEPLRTFALPQVVAARSTLTDSSRVGGGGAQTYEKRHRAYGQVLLVRGSQQGKPRLRHSPHCTCLC